MFLPQEGQLLRIFIGETDHHDGLPLYEWLVREARQRGLAGATVLRGVSGFGASSRIHTASVLRLSLDLPVVVEIVDEAAKIEAFLPVVDAVVKEGLVTLEKVQIKLYRANHDKQAPSA
jgi:PII-like signaling protein